MRNEPCERLLLPNMQTNHVRGSANSPVVCQGDRRNPPANHEANSEFPVQAKYQKSNTRQPNPTESRKSKRRRGELSQYRAGPEPAGSGSRLAPPGGPYPLPSPWNPGQNPVTYRPVCIVEGRIDRTDRIDGTLDKLTCLYSPL